MADVTIRDVAKAARVSTATVSRVVNGHPRVAPEMASRVMAAVEQLGYRPSATARRLVTGRTGLVGVVVPDLSNPFFHGVLKGLTAAGDEMGYGVVVADAEEHPEREATLAMRLLSQTDGLVLCSPRMDIDRLRAIDAEQQPTVCVNRSLTGVTMPCIVVDEYEGALSLAGHLLELGHRRIAYLHGPLSSWSDGERARALADAAKFGLETVSLECGSDPDSGYRISESLQELDVTAVVAFNDFVALGVLAGLRALGRNVPGDLALAGFDDIPLAAFTTPAITSVRRPVVELGREAWRALASLIDGVTVPEPARLRSQLVVRASTDSTGAVAASSPGSRRGKVGAAR